MLTKFLSCWGDHGTRPCLRSVISPPPRCEALAAARSEPRKIHKDCVVALALAPTSVTQTPDENGRCTSTAFQTGLDAWSSASRPSDLAQRFTASSRPANTSYTFSVQEPSSCLVARGPLCKLCSRNRANSRIQPFQQHCSARVTLPSVGRL